MSVRFLATASKQLRLNNQQLQRLLLTSASQQQQQQQQQQQEQKGGNEKLFGKAFSVAATLLGIGAGYWLMHELDKRRLQPQQQLMVQATELPRHQLSSPTDLDAEAIAEAEARLWHKTVRSDLATYSVEEVQRHNKPESGIWITYGLGVYDVTEFAPNHPGGDKILMAAGNAIDPFWAIYQQHNTLEVLQLLETFRIGNINKVDAIDDDELGSPWVKEPKRSPLLKPASKRPFNAEPPISLLGEHFYTPNELFYVRNHLPVPSLQPDEYELQLEVDCGAGQPSRTLKLDDIQKLPKHTVTAAIMCGGNRRSEMTQIRPVKGLSWGAGAVGNAKWSGARLCDLLRAQGVEHDERLHVVFEGADLDPTAHPYGASIPLSKALDPRGDVMLAYEMNDQPLSRDHGYPIRIIVPGTVGARNVKWLTRIVVTDHESDSHWQQNDYKGFSPSTDWDTVDFGKAQAIQAMPVTSAICTPLPEQRVRLDEGHITVRGYAWSGGGRRIERVDLTVDGGKSWHVATLEQEDVPDGRHYGWSLWTARLPVSADQQQQSNLEIWAKAVDSAYNVQPEAFEHIWNLRGVLANAYHKVKVRLI